MKINGPDYSPLFLLLDHAYVSANHPHGFRLLTIEEERERGIYYFKGIVNVPREAVHSFR